MPKTRAQPTSRAVDLLDEHKRLHAYVEKLEATLALPPLEARAAWAADLASSLAGLRPLLRAHFASEEQGGGLFEAIRAALPETARACEQLLGEHAGLLDRLDRLTARVQAGTPAEEAWRSLLAEVRSLCHDLARHEERENEFLFRSIEDETAAQD